MKKLTELPLLVVCFFFLHLFSPASSRARPDGQYDRFHYSFVRTYEGPAKTPAEVSFVRNKWSTNYQILDASGRVVFSKKEVVPSGAEPCRLREFWTPAPYFIELLPGKYTVLTDRGSYGAAGGADEKDKEEVVLRPGHVVSRCLWPCTRTGRGTFKDGSSEQLSFHFKPKGIKWFLEDHGQHECFFVNLLGTTAEERESYLADARLVKPLEVRRFGHPYRIPKITKYSIQTYEGPARDAKDVAILFLTEKEMHLTEYIESSCLPGAKIWPRSMTRVTFKRDIHYYIELLPGEYSIARHYNKPGLYRVYSVEPTRVALQAEAGKQYVITAETMKGRGLPVTTHAEGAWHWGSWDAWADEDAEPLPATGYYYKKKREKRKYLFTVEVPSE